MVLRGGAKPNYDSKSIKSCEKQLIDSDLPTKIMVDCSHGNTNKDYRLQPKVAKSIVNQVKKGNQSIMGIMLESNINAGNQSFPQPKEDLKYGVSITDGCINWEDTERAIRDAHAALAPLFAN